jgi:hypothetical protein
LACLPACLQIIEGEWEYEEGEEGAETLTAGRSSRQRSRKHFGEHSGWLTGWLAGWLAAAAAAALAATSWAFAGLSESYSLLEAWVGESCPLCCAHLLQGMIL